MQGLIPQQFIDDLLYRTDIVELIDSYVPLTKRGNSYLACCPFHTEKTPSFNVSSKKQFYNCFGCASNGNAISFVMAYLNQSFPEAIETLASRVGMEIPKRQGDTKQYQAKQNVYDLMHQVSLFYSRVLSDSGSAAKIYLEKRGIGESMVQTYQIGYAPPGWQTLLSQAEFKQKQRELLMTGMLIQSDRGRVYDRYRDRIIFPIHNRQGRIVGFGGRAIEAGQEPKYLNSPETSIFQKKHELYGLYQLTQVNRDVGAIWVVEGYMDVISLAQNGITNVVATLGTATSTYHIQLLAKYTKLLVFCFDGDKAGKKAAWRALESCLPYLHLGLDIKFVFLPEGEDPDSYVKKEGQAAFSALADVGTTLHHFFLETLTAGVDISQMAGKASILNAAKPYLQKIPDSAYKQLLMDELSKRIHIDSGRIAHLTEGNTIQATSRVETNITRTPLRLAVALLLQYPEIYTACEQAIASHIDTVKQYELLYAVITHIQKNPEVTTAALLEIWRHTSFFDAVCKLASWKHLVPEADRQREFVDIIRFLEKQTSDKAIEKLLEKSRQSGLSKEEQRHLQGLLKKRHEQMSIKDM